MATAYVRVPSNAMSCTHEMSAPRLRSVHVAPEPANPLTARQTTKFHARGERLGHGVWDLVFVRR